MSEPSSDDVLEVTLVTDGSSDRALMPIVNAVFDAHCMKQRFVIRFAEGVHTGRLAAKLLNAVSLYPCDVLLVHRDAEGQAIALREAEIVEATAAAGVGSPSVSIIPVRMTESWLLVDETAIRTASGNPNGRTVLSLPIGAAVERVDAKAALTAAIRLASELSVNRLRRLDQNRARQRVAELLDLRSLKGVASFQHFESQVRALFA